MPVKDVVSEGHLRELWPRTRLNKQAFSAPPCPGPSYLSIGVHRILEDSLHDQTPI